MPVPVRAEALEAERVLAVPPNYIVVAEQGSSASALQTQLPKRSVSFHKTLRGMSSLQRLHSREI
jgi:hypothetical protein